MKAFAHRESIVRSLILQPLNLSIAALQADYASGRYSPLELIAALVEKNSQILEDSIWIYPLSMNELAPYLDHLEQADRENKPLYGVPFAIKDNIDLAGIPTTSACREYCYTPKQHAFVVDALIQAGAIPIGKTNLDQFATGLVGTRSPYGAVKNAFDAEYISGGSSSGSAVAVAKGLVSFSLGTDTAGSGRIPAAFNNLIGVKATRGIVSTSGSVPACKSLDCITAFSLNPDDAESLFDVMAQYDSLDSFARKTEMLLPAPAQTDNFTFGVPQASQLVFFGNDHYKKQYNQFVSGLQKMGGQCIEVDFSPFMDCAKLLYEGPWVAERYAAIQDFIESDSNALLDVTRAIIAPAKALTAVDAFKSAYRLKELRRQAETVLAQCDFMVTPTAGTHYRIEAVQADPIQLNTDLGYYTNFMNLLDMSAVAIPAGFGESGLPFGVTIMGDHGDDRRLLAYARQILSRQAESMPLRQGATPFNWRSTSEDKHKTLNGYIKLAVCGAHLSGMPLNHQLLDRESELLEVTTTSEHYRFYALAGGPPYRPGLIRDEGNGAKIAIEVWAMPYEHFGTFMQGIPAPLGIGTLETASGEWVKGFICEPYAIETAEEITDIAGWRHYMAV